MVPIRVFHNDSVGEEITQAETMPSTEHTQHGILSSKHAHTRALKHAHKARNTLSCGTRKWMEYQHRNTLSCGTRKWMEYQHTNPHLCSFSHLLFKLGLGCGIFFHKALVGFRGFLGLHSSLQRSETDRQQENGHLFSRVTISLSHTVLYGAPDLTRADTHVIQKQIEEKIYIYSGMKYYYSST